MKIMEMKKLDKKSIEDICALTPLQEGLLFHYLKDPDSDHYFEQLSLEISGKINKQCFEKAWNFVVQSNQMLRTVFRWEKLAKPVQFILKEHKPQLMYYDVPGKGIEQKNQRLKEIEARDRKKKFFLGDVPFKVTLCQIHDKNHTMIISNHHILYDGWSNGIILKEFFDAYDAFAHNQTPRVPVKGSFKTFVKWLQEREQGELQKKQEGYWKVYLEGFNSPSPLSIKRTAAKDDLDSEISKINFQPDPATRNHMEEFARLHKVTVAAFLYSVWGILIQKYNNRNDVLLGTTLSGRSASANINHIENIVGLFINTVPLRVRTHARQNAVDLIRQINQSLRTREEYENSPLVKIREYSKLSQTDELFDSIVVFENYPLSSKLNEENRALKVNSFSIVEMTNYDLSLGIMLFEEIEFNLTYRRNIFDEEIIQNLSRHYIAVIESILKNPLQEVAYIQLLSAREKNTILHQFNQARSHPSPDKTIHQLFEEQVERTPHAVALVSPIIIAGSGSEVSQKSRITYSLLNEKSSQLAALLRHKGVTSDCLVGVIMERSMQMVMGILSILKAGGAYLPIDPHSPGQRTNFILENSGTQLVLCQNGIKIDIEDKYLLINIDEPGLFKPRQSGSSMPIASTSSEPHDLAYVIYTSGSTGKPKGVMVNHNSVVNLLSALHHDYPLPATDAWLLKTSYIFDVSVSELFGWFMEGGHLVILDRGFEKDPQQMLATISRECVTHINFVPSMFRLFVSMLNPENIGQLSHLKYIFCAGEALPAQLVRQFRNLNATIVLENIYGPTEATVYASRYSLSAWDGIGNIPIGKPIAGSTLYILGEDHQLQPIAVPGELVIGGSGLSRGYLNQPQLTEEKFINAEIGHSSLDILPFTNSPPLHRLYRSGDLCRWLPDGNIEYLGRIDNQVKIRGYRIELGEIENRLLQHEHVIETVVTVKEDKLGDKYICAYIVWAGIFNATTHAGQLREYLTQTLPGYMVPSLFMNIPHIPLNPSGKADRKALPQPERAAGETYTGPGDDIEKKLREVWAGVLAMEPAKIDVNADFFTLGGHSLKAITLVSQIHKTLDVKIPLGDLFKRSTIRRMAAYIKEAVRDNYTAVQPSEKRKYYPLSAAQRRFYIQQNMDRDSTAYNLFHAMSLNRQPDINKLEKAFAALIDRHESLRTSFHMIDEQIVQVIRPHVEFAMESLTLDTAAGNTQQQMIDRFIRPFDLTRPPLVRVALLKKNGEKCILMVDMHHITSDVVSMGILVHDFNRFYAGQELAPLTLHYKDYSQWQSKQFESGVLQQQEKYWLDRFKDRVPSLNLPIDFPRKETLSSEGQVFFEISPQLTHKIREYLKLNTGTMFIFLLAAYTILVSRYANQEDIVVVCPTADRVHGDLNQIVGVFINSVAMRNHPASWKSFKEFLTEVKENSIEAFENQSYPFDELITRLELPRHIHRNPLTDTAFGLIEKTPDLSELGVVNANEAALDDEYLPPKKARFDIELEAIETPEKIILHFDYSLDLFKRETIERKCRHLLNIIEEVVAEPAIMISAVKMLEKDELDELEKTLMGDSDQNTGISDHPKGKPKMEASFDF